ncbi:MAG: TolC family outer membrane protein [Chiayiivirga sp.]|jgi:outer membrane protein|uniref:TolC family outer membrane protein n=1 Tax=Chiayiivirga sp. TaxID=2041042 RepID=UPI0025BF9785|nr:TolC family outer membrane protein [Chiayiivirga sp.]MCI1711718.1 TolC family outer membrane protein [Chiayiivirga sp.]MCI1729704.1 TolC family outer membrane protein [Chiayiivirga sp.]
MTLTLRLRPICLALALSGMAGTASAADLLQAYELARQSDPQLAAAEAQRLAQSEGTVQARSALLPRISGSISLSDSDGASGGTRRISVDPPIFSSGVSFSDSRSRSSGIDLSQSIYNHANYTRLKAAKSRTAQADASYDAAYDNLILRVADAYFNVLTAIDSLAFARAEERAVKRQLDQADQRFEVGLTAITDVHEARARYDGSRANAIAAQVQLDDAREALSEITGNYLEGLKGLDDSFAPSLPSPDNLGAWVELALAQNPVLHSRTLALDAAGHDVATARSAHLPTLGASIGYSDGASWGASRSLGISSPSDGFNYDTTIGLQLSIPIFEGFATQSGVRQAIYTRDAAEEQLEQETRAVTRQTRNAFRALVAGITGIEARKQALVSAQSALEATEAGFEVGTRTIVDVLISQQVLFQAQRDYSTARHEFLVNGLRLKQAAGTVELKDVEEVNRFLVRDAEAALVEPAEANDPVDAPKG